MYINPFAAGVLATLFTEVIIIFEVAIYYTIKRITEVKDNGKNRIE